MPIQDGILVPQGGPDEGVLGHQRFTSGPQTFVPSDDIAAEIQKLSSSALIDLFTLDATEIGGELLNFHGGVNQLEAPIVWQGVVYQAYPIIASGFQLSGQGQTPRPKVTVSNFAYLVGVMALETDDLIMAKLTRRRTFAKYLDEVNFPGGINPTANPSMEGRREVWFVNRKINENDEIIEFELSAASDVDGLVLPARQVTSNVCVWVYRSGEGCPYAGPPVADKLDNPTSDITLDRCSHRKTGCQLRFGVNGVLPMGVFPAVGLIRT